jgi:alanine racemase
MSPPLSYIEISCAAVRANVLQCAARVPSGTRIIAVIKANAYGHGMAEIIAAVDDVVYGFQVDDIEELRLARTHTTKPIYVFGYVPQDTLAEMVMLGGILGVYDLAHIQALDVLGSRMGVVIPIHLKVDALLGRQGILSADVLQYVEVLQRAPHVKLEAVYSHFSNIEDVDTLEHAHAQYTQLLLVKKEFESHGYSDMLHHISATSGFLVDQSHNWGGCFVRLGIGMYGLWPSFGLERQYGSEISLAPVMRWVTHLAQVKTLPAQYPVGYGCSYVTATEMRVGVVPQGYSDGYDRGLSNCGEVLVRGVRCPIIGRVAMNMCMIDVGAVPDVTCEDEVVLLGEQGGVRITAEDIANHSDTINYEVVARISALLPRVCVDRHD